MLLSHAQTRWLIGSVAALAFVGFARRTSPAAGAVPDDAPAARVESEITTQPMSLRGQNGAACDEAIATVKGLVARPEGEVTDDDVLHLCGTVQTAATESAVCAARIRDVLATEKTCGRAYGAVASCAASSPDFLPSYTRELMTHASASCQLRLVSSLHQAKVVDRDLLLMVSELAEREPVPSRRARVWLALGTLERNARAGDAEAKVAAKLVDAQIAKKLHAAVGRERLVMLETAGNAGCDGCVLDVRAQLSSDDPALRRAAIAAMRFRDDEASLASMCDALAREPEGLVREHAAWSLRWSSSNEVTRSACLERAARSDESDNVRHAAEQSLFALSDRAPTAATALAELTGAASPDEIAWLATTLSGDAPASGLLGKDGPGSDLFGSMVQ